MLLAMRNVLALLLAGFTVGFKVPIRAATAATALRAVSLPRVSDGENVDLGAALARTTEKTMLCFGTHAADFNTVEYMQRLRVFLPKLQAKGISRVLMVVNGDASQVAKLAGLLDMPVMVELLADPAGEAGRAFGVSRGFRPDDERLSSFAKLFVVGIGLGPPWGTLWPVMRGYLGDRNGRREWIQASLQQGQSAGRWPDPLQLSEDGERVIANAFDNTPLLGGWGVRPFELATLRLQNLIMQAQNWGQLKPLDDRCLTQLGGCTVVGAGGETLYSWVDQGLCDLPDMEDLIEAL
uniref:Uncharacterized protein n=1 Tax=Coccolithus braarudii TaxID=221442 RepID=A0A7S0LUB8_9EUKA|mmetsp:Transcript_659/g.1278  ORF Transcript_659/g.1278 Transcript_659/m.1278 type:complete len:295 (+) Transcript_659:41-925(+)